MSFHRTVALILVCLAAACASDRPLVERFEVGEPRPTPFRLVSSGGQYAAPTVVFVLRFEDPSGTRLRVEGTVEIDPQPRLVDGLWVEEHGTTKVAGALSSESVEYYGGQGGRPSLAGRFVLAADGTVIYRINLPRTTLTAER